SAGGTRPWPPGPSGRDERAARAPPLPGRRDADAGVVGRVRPRRALSRVTRPWAATGGPPPVTGHASVGGYGRATPGGSGSGVVLRGPRPGGDVGAARLERRRHLDGDGAEDR